MGLQRSKTALIRNILESARNEVLSLSASEAVDHLRPGPAGGVPAARPRARHGGDAGGGDDASTGTSSGRRSPSTRRSCRPKTACCRPPRPAGTCTTTTSRPDRSPTARDGPTARPPTGAPTRRRWLGHLPGLEGAVDAAGAGQPHPRGPRDPRRLLQPPAVLRPGHQPADRSLCGEQDVEARAGPAQLAERGRLPGGGLRGVLPGAGRAEGLRRLARLRRSAHDRDHGAPAADRAHQRRPVRPPAMAGGRPGEDGRGLPARTRSDDEERFTLPDRGPGDVPRDPAKIASHEPRRRYRREARHDDPDRSRGRTRRRGRPFGARPA